MLKIKYLLFILLIVFFDQLTKWTMTQHLLLHESYTLLPLFNLTLLHNEGSAFSFLSDAGGWQRWFLMGVTIVVIAIMFAVFCRLTSKDRLQAMALSCTLGGAIGNLIDRIRYGYVVDFLDFHLHSWHWPVFNMADSFICLGAAFLFWDALHSKAE